MHFVTYLSDFLSGTIITLTLTLSAIALGLMLAIIFTIGTTFANSWVKKPIAALVFFITGTPLLVQIFLLYYGVGQFEWIRATSLWIVLREPMACAIIALSLNTAAYTSILLQGAIQSVPKSEVAACEALAMTKWQAFKWVIFPRAFRIAIPAYSNEVIMILKSSSLASTITLLEIMGVTQALIAQTYQPIEWYMVAGVIYLILNFFIIMLFKKLHAWATQHRQIGTFFT